MEKLCLLVLSVVVSLGLLLPLVGCTQLGNTLPSSSESSSDVSEEPYDYFEDIIKNKTPEESERSFPGRHYLPSRNGVVLLLPVAHHENYARGMRHLDKGEYADALNCFEAVPKHEEPAANLDLLIAKGFTQICLGNYDEAEPLLFEALEQSSQVMRSKYYLIAAANNNLGVYYLSRNMPSKALPYFQKASDIMGKYYSAHIDIVLPQYNLAYTNFVLGDLKSMKKFLKETIYYQVYLNDYEPGLTLTTDTFIAELYLMLSEDLDTPLEEAQYNLTQSIEVLETEEHPTIANNYELLGRVHEKRGEYEEALTALEKALQIRQKFFSDTHIAVYTSYYWLAHIHFSIGDVELASSNLKKAFMDGDAPERLYLNSLIYELNGDMQLETSGTEAALNWYLMAYQCGERSENPNNKALNEKIKGLYEGMGLDMAAYDQWLEEQAGAVQLADAL